MATVDSTCGCSPLASSPCFSWCDHQRSAVEHESAAQHLAFPGSMESVLTTSAVVHDELDVAGVSVQAGANDGALLSPGEADDFADRLIAFASKVRTQAREVAATRKGSSRALEVARAAVERIDAMGQTVPLGRIRATLRREANRVHRVGERERKADRLFTRHHFDPVMPPHAAEAISEADSARIWSRRDADLLMAMIGSDEAEAMDRLRRLAG